MRPPTILIIGAGQAGGCAAATLRKEGYQGRIVLAGVEEYRPYERPPLSKGVLDGSQSDTSIFLHTSSFYEEVNIEWLPKVHIESICADSRVATMSGGETIAFDQCLIATGGRPREFVGVNEDMPNVHYLRSLADVVSMRKKIKPAARAVVIGGGFLGLEFASTVHAQGVEVTVLEAGDCIMGRAVPRIFSAWLADRYEKAGIEIVCNAKIQSIDYGETGGQVRLDGRVVESDFCLIAIGQLPNVELAEAAGLTVNNGIVVDASGETSAPGIFAAGDCASHFNCFLKKMVRLESWQNAQEQAIVAAKAMIGVEAHYNVVPWFWSDQLGFNIQMLGSPEAHLRYVVRGDTTADQFIIFGFDGETPRCVLAVNKGGDIRPLRTLLETHLVIASETLLDTSRSLREIVKAAAA
jgi:3-phenylpropionate/trans-cinnamate dioxygenase ferredoxin reductase subunit